MIRELVHVQPVQALQHGFRKSTHHEQPMLRAKHRQPRTRGSFRDARCSRPCTIGDQPPMMCGDRERLGNFAEAAYDRLQCATRPARLGGAGCGFASYPLGRVWLPR